MKKFFMACSILLLASFVCASSIRMPSQIPESISWGATLSFDSFDSFERAEFFADSERLATIYSTGSELVLGRDSLNNAFVSSALVDGSSVYLSCPGLGAGTRKMKLKLYDEDTLVEEVEQEAEFYSIIERINSSALRSELSSLSSTVKQLDFTLGNMRADDRFFKKKIEEMQQATTEMKQKLSEMSASIDSIEKSIADNAALAGSAKQSVSELEKKFLIVEERIGPAVAAAADKQAGDASAGSRAGFVLLSDVFSPVVALGAVVIIVAIIFFAERKLRGLDLLSGRRIDEFGLPRDWVEGDEKQKQVAEARGGEEKPRKWAYNGG